MTSGVPELLGLSVGFQSSADSLGQLASPGDSDGGDFMSAGLDQLTLCSQSLGFGTPAAPAQ
ncbi:hypothetical protein STEG23_033281, partial [Scotinomys teguina]